MLDQLTIESFEPHVGQTFWLREGDHRVELRLTRVARIMESEAARLPRIPFSLYFVGPESLYLPQKTYHLDHEAFGEGLDIFLVPVGRDAAGFQYEAVFT